MSQQKFASNVIEKCLVHGSYEERQMIINEVLSTDGKAEALKVLVKDQYANCVVQKVMETCDEWQRKLMLGHLKSHHGELSHYPYTRHVVTRLERLIQAGESHMTPSRHSRRPGKEHVGCAVDVPDAVVIPLRRRWYVLPTKASTTIIDATIYKPKLCGSI